MGHNKINNPLTMLRSRHMRHSSSIRIDSKLPKISQSFHNPQLQKSNLLQMCPCNLCNHKLIPKYSSNSELSRQKPSSLCKFDKTSLEIILSSLLGKNKKKGLNICIPETCFYKNGKPETMFIHNLQEIKSISVRKLNSRQIFQDFLKRRLEARLNTSKISQKVSQQLCELHEKLFEKIHPTHLEQASSQQLKERVFILHKSKKIQILEEKSEGDGECCVSYFSDGSVSLLAQDQFKTLRNDSKYFDDLQYIQILVPSIQTVLSQFDQYSCINDKELFNLARIQVDNILQLNLFNPHPQTSEHHQSSLKSLFQTPSKLALFQTYKIIHYIIKTSNLIICSLKLNWLITKELKLYLLNVISMNYKRRETDEIKRLLISQLEVIKNKNSAQLENIESMQEIMLANWKRVKLQKSLEQGQEEGGKEGEIKASLARAESLRVPVSIKPQKISRRLFRNRSVAQRK